MFDADVVDGTIQHILTLSLAEILTIARLEDAPYATCEKAFSPDENLPSRTTTFSTQR